MKRDKIIPYSTHYDCHKEMFGTATLATAAQYLFDIHQHLARRKATLKFNVPIDTVSKRCSISWEASKKALETLKEIELIDDSDGNCIFDAGNYYCLIRAFNELQKDTDKKKFTKHLLGGDYKSLESFGYVYEKNADKCALEMKGVFSDCYQESDSDETEKHPRSKISDSIARNIRILSEILEYYQKSDNDTIRNLRVLSEILESNCQISDSVVENMVAATPNLYHEIQTLFSKNDINNKISVEFSEYLTKSEFEWAIDQVGSRKNRDDAGSLLVFLEITIRFLRVGLSDFLEFTIRNLIAINNNNINNYLNNSKQLGEDNNIKENIGVSITPKKEKEKKTPKAKEGVDDEEILSAFEKLVSEEIGQEQGSQGEAEEEESDWRPWANKPEPKQKRSEILSTENYDKRKRMPFVSGRDVELAISGLQYCLDSPVKIFINQVWEELGYRINDDLEDENGNCKETENDPEGYKYPAEKIDSEILLPAYKRTIEIIEAGEINENGEILPVTCQEMKPEYVGLIVDWKKETTRDGEVYLITKRGFKDIFAEEVPAAKKRGIKNSREGREDDIEYMRQIVLLGANDDRWGELSPIELAVYNFLREYFELEADGTVGLPLIDWVSKTDLSLFYLRDVRERGLKNEEFYNVLFVPKMDQGTLTLKTRMFDSQKIKEWNQFRGHRSLV